MKSIELFVGAGGLAIGASRAGFKPVLMVDRDRWCCDTIRENRARRVAPAARWPKPFDDDIRLVDFTSYRDDVVAITGGPPCQPFSIGGRHLAHGDHRDMWGEAVRAIREARPRAFIFENVKGLARQSFATYLGYILLQLQYPSMERGKRESWAGHLRRLQSHHTKGAELEYRVVHELVNAANFGVPQKRERVVFVGFRADVGSGWSFPDETHSLEALLYSQFRSGEYWDRNRVLRRQGVMSPRLVERGKRIIDKPDTLPWITVREALTDLPAPERGGGGILNHRFQPGARSYPGHTGSPLDEPAKTLKAGVHGVPGGENMMRRADGSVRYFTVRESARLQTFPDDYELHGAWGEAMRQIGNAVPVTLGYVIAQSVRSHLATDGRCARKHSRSHGRRSTSFRV